ncbi:cation:proton antiporter [Thermasporomyces composti]|uniref:Sodium/proton antiporter (CPA1 family) n=1 Tax=Thermasporomyces composti TaxID=696763 RepID=A0A3D9VC98_THECX|nr:cation:proton antiporter [Thermasporomyces composti]REF38323.1 sodium/proton antiporter (CPA1 family) [Thermasporomyces composti]
MTAEEFLLGVSITLILAVTAQITAGRLNVPALILLLPAGFTAGAFTDLVNARALLGRLYEPVVAFSVAVILFNTCLELDPRQLRGALRRAVAALVVLGVPVTWAATTFSAIVLHGMSESAALLLGAILVVSGPTVLGPILDFVRPAERLQRLLTWEGTLVDPIGAILGAVVFHAVVARGPQTIVFEAGQFLASIVVGVGAAVVGALLLWFTLRLRLPAVLSTAVTVASVVAVAAAADVVRDDTGLIAAIIMGLVFGRLPGVDVAAHQPFFGTVVQLILGVLFVAISATVTPSSVLRVLPPTLALVGILVLVVRPLVAFAATSFTELTRRERAFVGWMAPRGIVAAATASVFSAGLVAEGIPGAEDILPATFLVIMLTVLLYGLTGPPVARLLGVTRPAHTRPFLVGGAPWVVDLGRTLQDIGVDVLMWAGREEERRAIRQAGLEVAPGEFLAAAAGGGAAMEGVNAVFLLTEEDDFNALAATILRARLPEDARVYRVAPAPGSQQVAAPFLGGVTLFAAELTRDEIDRRYRAGARVVIREGDPPPEFHPLLVVRAGGRIDPVTREEEPRPGPGDVLVLFGPPRAD